MQILSYSDQKYPYLLKEIYDPPQNLYCEGNIDLLNMKCISLVGTRNITKYGKYLVNEFLLNEYSLLDVVFVSGLALGIDGFVHQKCLERGLKTIAITPGGFGNVIPKKNMYIYEEIKKKGLVVSEFPSERCFGKEMFVLRNRLIAGISKATVVFEAGEKSGSLITARYALDFNRDVYAVPGNICNHFSQGCNLLLKDGANLLTSKYDFGEIVGMKGSQALLNIS
jgi:DNA processing protein